jgi:hypothetical protein
VARRLTSVPVRASGEIESRSKTIVTEAAKKRRPSDIFDDNFEVNLIERVPLEELLVYQPQGAAEDLRMSVLAAVRQKLL